MLELEFVSELELELCLELLLLLLLLEEELCNDELELELDGCELPEL